MVAPPTIRRIATVRRVPSISALLGAALLLACGDGKSGQQNSIAKAFEQQADPQKNAREAGEQMRKLREKAETDREAAIVAEIDRAATVPSSLPADIKSGCAAMRTAFDGFVAKRLAGDKSELDRWKVMKGVDLDPAEEHCVAQNNLQFAACQEHAFRKAAPSIPRGRAQELIDTCAKKAGAQTRAEIAAAGKPA
jgi:hypothetical protein